MQYAKPKPSEMKVWLSALPQQIASPILNSSCCLSRDLELFKLVYSGSESTDLGESKLSQGVGLRSLGLASLAVG